MNSEAVIIEAILAAPVDKVWKAITDERQMRQWYFNVSAFKPKAGFEFTFEGPVNGKAFTHRCRVTAAEAYKKLAYIWKYEGHSGESLVTFELYPGGNTTRIKLTHSGTESFPEEISNSGREYFVQLWDQLMNKSLPEFLIK
ncbi:MAG: SRPBCC domain-containing protein [Bacteroidia bacterium]|jgi:uncharacterized protein YndB with AHSA1/START domain|nr:SRPBCC domain-containing protein [Bacteroidia bacterium]